MKLRKQVETTSSQKCSLLLLSSACTEAKSLSIEEKPHVLLFPHLLHIIIWL